MADRYDTLYDAFAGVTTAFEANADDASKKLDDAIGLGMKLFPEMPTIDEANRAFKMIMAEHPVGSADALRHYPPQIALFAVMSGMTRAYPTKVQPSETLTPNFIRFAAKYREQITGIPA